MSNPQRIRRIGLAVELEDGSKVELYTEDCDGMDVAVNTETEAYRDWTGRSHATRQDREIVISGVNSYLIQFTDAPPAEQPALPAPMAAALQDAEGRALVQAIHDRKGLQA